MKNGNVSRELCPGQHFSGNTRWKARSSCVFHRGKSYACQPRIFQADTRMFVGETQRLKQAPKNSKAILVETNFAEPTIVRLSLFLVSSSRISSFKQARTSVPPNRPNNFIPSCPADLASKPHSATEMPQHVSSRIGPGRGKMPKVEAGKVRLAQGLLTATRVPDANVARSCTQIPYPASLAWFEIG